MKATVKQSFFRGNHYLIQVDFNNRNIHFKNDKAIRAGQEVFLDIDKEILNKRGLTK